MKNNFTKIVLAGISVFFICAIANAQTGLQNIIVEKYYISDSDDSIASIGNLPVGSVTYRVFVDMKQGYKFQAAYGVPTHTLFIKTTTSFFNNEDRGNITPTYTKTQAKNNTVMLDSWLSAGAACSGNFGVLKSEDDGNATVVNSDGVLKNNDATMGFPLTEQDGLLAGTPGDFTKIGLDPAIEVFDAVSQAGNSFEVTNGAWSYLYGAVGPDTTNKVLIAQLTTEGVLSFELNLQLGTPSGGTEQYVAKDAVDQEIVFPSLTFNSDSLFTGIDKAPVKASNNTSVSVYPNPSNGKFTLDINPAGKISSGYYAIYNLVGKVILKKEFNNASGNITDKIDLSSYPTGFYFAETMINGKKATRKLIVK
jgi:hypothetical protein